MKRILLILTCVALLGAMGCQKRRQIRRTEGYMTDGTWKITSFNENEEIKTADFAGDVFTFKKNGDLVVTGTHPMNGTWDIHKTNNDDNLNTFMKFVLHLSGNLEEISDDWDIQTYTNYKLELKDASGGNGGVDFLTFEKI